MIDQTSLILHPDGSIYHLALHPEELASTIILVGDPQRVPRVSQYFDRIEIKKSHREFCTHTGTLGQQRLSVIGTGIGVGNIDIVINECDALANIDFKQRCVKTNITPLTFLRLGTSGALHANIALDSLLISTAAVGFDGLLHFYQAHALTQQQPLLTSLQQHFQSFPSISNSYVGYATPELVKQFTTHTQQGITISCIGFYGPQHRTLRAAAADMDLLLQANRFCYNGQRITNFEMETAAIYALANLLGHRCCSVNTIIANRITASFSRHPQQAIEKMIEQVLDLL